LKFPISRVSSFSRENIDLRFSLYIILY
jgi:hypothetical protein